MSRTGVLLAVLACAAVIAQGVDRQKTQLRQLRSSPSDTKDLHSAGFVRALEFKHQLRVCNAFPSGTPLHISRSKEVRLTGDEPMPYKVCRDFSSPLKAGDKLEFLVGDASAGTFSVSDLPNTDAVLLLVLHRHDTISTAVAFESHVFADLANAQVAIIDTYKGATRSTNGSHTNVSLVASKSTLRIMDATHSNLVSAAQTKNAVSARTEELRYDSVIAVNQGIYEVEIDSPEGKAEAKHQLVALNHESYVILRTGVEAQEGPSYPQELVVFPSSNPGLVLPSGVGQSAAISLVTLLAAMAAVLA